MVPIVSPFHPLSSEQIEMLKETIQQMVREHDEFLSSAAIEPPEQRVPFAPEPIERHADPLDHASEITSGDTRSGYRVRVSLERDRLARALSRLERTPQAFGQCATCAGNIPFERLFIIPYAQKCVTCKSSSQ